MPEMTTVAWNLGDLFASIDDPKIEQALDNSLARAKAFAAKYRGEVDSPDLTAQALFEAISEYEDLIQELVKPASFAGLTFSADTSKPEHGALMQHVQERQTEISLELMFFELELMAASPEIINRLLDAPVLARYRHFIIASRLFREHRLSEPEEKILEEKANTGGRAFDRLFDETISAMEFTVTLEGEQKVMTEPEVLALLRDPRREVRKAAAEAFTKGLADDGRLLTFIFNTLVYDKSVDDRLRRYAYPEQARNLANELEPETVETVMKTCHDNYSLVARYYRIKREILGYDKLTHYDRYAPLFQAKAKYTWDQARETVLDSFGRFSKVMAETAGKFFENGWIDAAPRKGKRGGAFCSYTTTDLHPYVLLTYLNKVDDVMTLGHELGHGVHACLARPRGYLNFSSVLPVAELASTFGEMLVFQNISQKLSLNDKLVLYAEKIESIFATVFRQAAMFKFEQELHRARRDRGELTSDQIGDIWQRCIQEMFQDSVELGEDHKRWWSYIGHFVGSPFYVYAYSFGELLVMALYSMYKQQGESFVPKFIEMLSTGGARSPQELLGKVGIDIKSPEFWQGGVDVIGQLVGDFEKLYAEWKGKGS